MASGPSKRPAKGKEKKPAKKARTGTPDSGTTNTADVVQGVIDALAKLNFSRTPSHEQTFKPLYAEIITLIKPGPALLGSRQEEEELYTSGRVRDSAHQDGQDKEDDALMVPADAASDVEMSEAGSDGEPRVKTEDEQIKNNAADFAEYQAPDKKKADPEEEEILGMYEGLPHGNDYILLEDGRLIPVWEYFGPDWDARVAKLHSIEPMAMPPDMVMIPKFFQLLAAAQGLYCISGPMKIFFLGDEMGVGKTLTAVLMMWAKRNEPGMSIVLAPKSVCQNWTDTINTAWKEGHGMKAFHLEDSSMALAQLLAGGYDVIIVSYEFYEANGRGVYAHEEKITKKANSQSPLDPAPSRPTSALHSEVLKILGLPWKLAILDEAQKVQKQGKLRHESIKNNLDAKAFALLSGTFTHNRWYNVGGPLAFAKNTPFDTMPKFLHTFASFSQTRSLEAPSRARMRLLQKFLQAIMIARPASILNLKGCIQFGIDFALTAPEVDIVERLTFEYEQVAGMNNSEAAAEIGDADNGSRIFGLAVKAQVSAFHPMMAEDVRNRRLQILGERFQDGIIDLDEDVDDNQARHQWLERAAARENLIEESGRLTGLVKLYGWVTSTFPGEKVIIFSQSLKFLDLVAEAFRRKYNVECVRFDGTVPATQRRRVESTFAECDAAIPLLITITAGGVGLNIQHASIVIVTEPQWNRNTERQAMGRAYRQGQDKVVKFYRLQGLNSRIDHLVAGVQHRKSRVNEELMRPLIRLPGEGPANIEILEYPGLLPMDLA